MELNELTIPTYDEVEVDFSANGSVNSPVEEEEFHSIASRGKQCKSAGLSGSEKRECKRIIKSKCGTKPLFGRNRKSAWERCSSNAVVEHTSPPPSAPSTPIDEFFMSQTKTASSGGIGSKDMNIPSDDKILGMPKIAAIGLGALLIGGLVVASIAILKPAPVVVSK